MIDPGFYQGLSVFFLSLWKTWLGPLLSVPYGFSYWEMITWNLGGAILSAAVTLHFSRNINELIRRLLPRKKDKPHFRGELRRYVRLWRRYGFYAVMALTPVLIGIPVGVWVSARLGTHKLHIFLALVASCVLWTSALYFSARAGVTYI